MKEPKAKKVTGKTARRAARIEGEAVEPVDQSCADPMRVAVLVVDYSGKAIAVIGDTAPIKDDLKAMGGRFNARLTVEGQKVAGWIFSKSKEPDVMAYVKKLNESGTADPMAAPEPMTEAETIEAETVTQSTEKGEEEQTAERMKEITNGLESLRGLDESGILEKLTAAGDVLKQSPEFWRMLNEAADPSAALSKALLSHLLIIGRNENKQGAA